MNSSLEFRPQARHSSKNRKAGFEPEILHKKRCHGHWNVLKISAITDDLPLRYSIFKTFQFSDLSGLHDRFLDIQYLKDKASVMTETFRTL